MRARRRRSPRSSSPAERANCAVSGVAVAPVPLSNYAIDIEHPVGDRRERRRQTSLGDRPGPARDAAVDGARLARPRRARRARVVLLARSARPGHAEPGGDVARRARGASSPIRGSGSRSPSRRSAFAWQGLVRRRVLDTLGRRGAAGADGHRRAVDHRRPGGDRRGGRQPRRPGRARDRRRRRATGDPSQPAAQRRGGVRRRLRRRRSTARGATSSSATSPGATTRRRSIRSLHAVAVPARGRLPRGGDVPRPGPGARPVRTRPAARSRRSSRAPRRRSTEARTNGAPVPRAAGRAPSGGRSSSARPARRRSTGRSAARPTPTACTAPTAPQAEFRTASGTWPRVGGLLLIVAGTLGMLLLLGFIALRLLGAALATLLYLLLAPLAVLAPALGRQRPRHVPALADAAGRLALAKLVYSVALGVVLLVVDAARVARRPRLVDAVAARVGVLVDRVRAPPPDAVARAARARRAGPARARWRRGPGSRGAPRAPAPAPSAVARAGARRRRRDDGCGGRARGAITRKDGRRGAACAAAAERASAQPRAAARAELRAQAERAGSVDAVLRRPRTSPVSPARRARIDAALESGARPLAIAAAPSRSSCAARESRARPRGGAPARTGSARVLPGRRCVAPSPRAPRTRDARSRRAVGRRATRARARLAGLAGMRPRTICARRRRSSAPRALAIERQLRRRRELLDRAAPAPVRAAAVAAARGRTAAAAARGRARSAGAGSSAAAPARNAGMRARVVVPLALAGAALWGAGRGGGDRRRDRARLGAAPRRRHPLAASSRAAPPAPGVRARRRRRSPTSRRAYLRSTARAAARFGLDWTILAGIGRVECDHGRTPTRPAPSRGSSTTPAPAGRRSSSSRPGGVRDHAERDRHPGHVEPGRRDLQHGQLSPRLRRARATTPTRSTPTTTPGGTSQLVLSWARRYPGRYEQPAAAARRRPPAARRSPSRCRERGAVEGRHRSPEAPARAQGGRSNPAQALADCARRARARAP